MGVREWSPSKGPPRPWGSWRPFSLYFIKGQKFLPRQTLEITSLLHCPLWTQPTGHLRLCCSGWDWRGPHGGGGWKLVLETFVVGLEKWKPQGRFSRHKMGR